MKVQTRAKFVTRLDKCTLSTRAKWNLALCPCWRSVRASWMGTHGVGRTSRMGCPLGGIGSASSDKPSMGHPDPKPLQLHRCFDQTFNEHESPLRYPGSVETPKYLMGLMLLNPRPPHDAPIHERNLNFYGHYEFDGDFSPIDLAAIRQHLSSEEVLRFYAA